MRYSLCWYTLHWPIRVLVVWRRVLQDLQCALQYDRAFPQRAHKEQHHLPWVRLDKVLTIKHATLTRPWQSLNHKIWSLDKALTRSWQNMTPLFEQERLVWPAQGGRARDSAKWPGVRLSQALMMIFIFDQGNCCWYRWSSYKWWLKLEYVQGFWWPGQHSSSGHSKATRWALQVANHYHHQ